ncbi:MAG: MBL fold metallo-hydrolase [Actinomycetota bacterium]|nr:MBL fold metallo-hydrolase [Actinomycetota bacterium]
MTGRRLQPAPGIDRLVTPLPFEGLDRVNAYALSDDDGGITLVDCGIFDEGAGAGPLEDALRASGRRVADVRRLVITHPHPDHYGLAGMLVEETGCELWMHSEGRADLDVYRDPGAAADALSAAFARHGVPDSELGELRAYEDWRPFISGVVEASHWLEGEEAFMAGARRWEVVHTPGHDDAHICLWSQSDGLLISGDTLLSSITPHVDHRGRLGPDPLGDFLGSLGRLEELGPSLVLPGHGRPFDSGAERARAIAAHHQRRLGSFLQVIRRRARSAADVAEEVYGTELLDFQRRLAVGETIAHLEYLRLRSEAELTEEDGVYMYEKTKR